MKPSEVFGVVVRIIGLLFILAGMAYGISVIIVLLGVGSSYKGHGILSYGISFIIFSGTGLFFLRGAPPIVRFAYPETKNTTAAHQPQCDQPYKGADS